MDVMIVVTHLLGTGHLSRALTLARTFAAAGHPAHVVSGGMPVPHLDHAGITLTALPALRSDGVDFSRLLTPSDNVADALYHDRRREALLTAFSAHEPDVLITELFPFGRRNLSTEFEALLDAARIADKRPVICASIRDILAPPSKPAKAERANDLVSRLYDCVLVHSDPEITRLDDSWPVSEALRPKLRYTGFVAQDAPEPHPQGTGAGEILVSAGGGDVGAPLFAAAADAARASTAHVWRLLIGGHDAARHAHALTADAPPNLIAEPARPDFRQMLPRAAASVSLCGYNTALDVLQTGVPAVFVPFDEGDEVEQGLRATALERLPGIETLKTAELSGQRLAVAVAKTLTAPARPPRRHGLDGAVQTVRIVESLRA